MQYQERIVATTGNVALASVQVLWQDQLHEADYLTYQGRKGT